MSIDFAESQTCKALVNCIVNRLLQQHANIPEQAETCRNIGTEEQYKEKDRGTLHENFSPQLPS